MNRRETEASAADVFVRGPGPRKVSDPKFGLGLQKPLFCFFFTFPALRRRTTLYDKARDIEGTYSRVREITKFTTN